jgi:hypothetical protein
MDVLSGRAPDRGPAVPPAVTGPGAMPGPPSAAV